MYFKILDRKIIYGALICSLLLLSTNTLAHKNSDSYLQLSTKDNSIIGQWNIAVRDLQLVVKLDTNQDTNITWQEIRDAYNNVHNLLLSAMHLSNDGQSCVTQYQTPKIIEYSDGYYVNNRFIADCKHTINNIELDYSFLLSVDNQHRALVVLRNLGQTQTGVISENQQKLSFSLSEGRLLDTAIEYITQGIWHIWNGFDHILFLFILLLPSVLLLKESHWQYVNEFKTVLVNSTKIITTFTLAHSITLGISMFYDLQFSSRWVESLIAASVIVAALNNIFPVINKRVWLMVFAFGLIHGLGFASVLSELGLPLDQKGLSLFAFNFGVEVGQLIIVSVLLPLIYLLRKYQFYTPVVLRAGSFGAITVSAVWFCERAFKINLLPI